MRPVCGLTEFQKHEDLTCPSLGEKEGHSGHWKKKKEKREGETEEGRGKERGRKKFLEHNKASTHIRGVNV